MTVAARIGAIVRLASNAAAELSSPRVFRPPAVGDAGAAGGAPFVTTFRCLGGLPR